MISGLLVGVYVVCMISMGVLWVWEAYDKYGWCEMQSGCGQGARPA